MSVHAPPSSVPTHAVVIGGSVAGLTAARVLADHVDRVTVLERDALPAGPTDRRGTPQARHVHALLIRGQRILEGLFPGLTEAVVAAGGETPNMGLDAEWHMLGGVRPRYASALTPLCMSRPLLEAAIRERAVAWPGIAVRGGVAVEGLVAEQGRVTGVRLRDAETGEEEVLRADLVVDASGRGSKAPDWLVALGYSAPRESVITSKAGYATRVYARPAGFDAWRVLYVQPSPPWGRRGAIITPIEGDRWHVTLIGMAGDHPPTDEAGFVAFADSLPVGAVGAAIRMAEPLSPIYGFHRGENRLRHFEALAARPEGFVALGDAVYALNPVYGQGMTLAAIGAETLGAALAAEGIGARGLAARFQAALAGAITGPWQLATGEDLRWPIPENAGLVPPEAQAVQAYIDAVQRLSLVHADVAEAFYRVQHMLDEPGALFRPDIVLRVLAMVAAPAPQPAAQAA